jgi:hypothetical protein
MRIGTPDLIGMDTWSVDCEWPIVRLDENIWLSYYASELKLWNHPAETPATILNFSSPNAIMRWMERGGEGEEEGAGSWNRLLLFRKSLQIYIS